MATNKTIFPMKRMMDAVASLENASPDVAAQMSNAGARKNFRSEYANIHIMLDRWTRWHDAAEADEALKLRPVVMRDDVHHVQPTVDLAANYLRDLGILTDDNVMLALTALFGETHAEVPNAADTTGILAAELFQRMAMAMQSGKRQVIGLSLPMLDGAHDSLHAIADELGYTLPCRCETCKGDCNE